MLAGKDILYFRYAWSGIVAVHWKPRFLTLSSYMKFSTHRVSACHLQNRISYKKTGKTPYELWKGHAPNLKYLKVWGCLAKVMLPDPKMRKIGSKTYDCMFIRYASNIAAYRFLVLKSDVLECNTITETKNA